jgi:small-conductance mechanosensitive channel
MRPTVAFLAAVAATSAYQGPARPIQHQPSADATHQVPAGAPVIFNRDTLFLIQAPLGPFTAADRAAAVSSRLQRIARDRALRSDTLATVVQGATANLMIGDVVVTSVTAADAAAAGLSRDSLAAVRARTITAALAGQSLWADVRILAFGLLFTLLATGVLVVLLKLLGHAYPRVRDKLESWRGTRIPSLRIQRLEIVSASRVTDGLIGLARILRVLIIVVLLFYYLPLVFSFFPWTRGFAGTLLGYVLTPLGQAWTGFVAYLPDLFAIAVVVVVVRYLLKFIRLFFLGLERGAITFPGFYRDWGEPTYKIVRFLVIVFAAVMVYPYLPGSDTAAFKGISIFLGILVSFGSSSAIANVIAGVVMTYMRPFQIGDRVKIADTVGDVVRKTLLITRVRTIKNVDVTIPNAMVLASHITNYNSSAKERGLILHTSLSIGYGAPWRRVHELLVAAAEATDGILKNPAPFVLQTALSDFYVSYELNAYTEKPNEMARIYSDLHENIQDTFNQAGVEIMSPHYTALREGNRAAIPEEHLPKGYRAPAFRVSRPDPDGGPA